MINLKRPKFPLVARDGQGLNVYPYVIWLFNMVSGWNWKVLRTYSQSSNHGLLVLELLSQLKKMLPHLVIISWLLPAPTRPPEHEAEDSLQDWRLAHHGEHGAAWWGHIAQCDNRWHQFKVLHSSWEWMKLTQDQEFMSPKFSPLYKCTCELKPDQRR